jgi:hypothetical protein
MKKLFLALLVVLMFLVACAPQTQTVVQVVTATPEYSSPVQSSKYIPCTNENKLDYLNPMLPWMDSIVAGMDAFTTDLDANDIDAAMADLHVIKSYMEKVNNHTSGNSIPECFGEYNDNLHTGTEYGITGIEKILNGDIDAGVIDFKTGMTYIERATSNLESME